MDQFIEDIASTVSSGDYSQEYQELVRIIQEQGVEQALAYVDTQWDRLLREADEGVGDIERAKRDVRRKLTPGLKSVTLMRDQGAYDSALRRCEELLAKDPTWPEARSYHIWTLVAIGDRALLYATTADWYRS